MPYFTLNMIGEISCFRHNADGRLIMARHAYLLFRAGQLAK